MRDGGRRRARRREEEKYNLQAVYISIPIALRGTLSFITTYRPPETICMQIEPYIWLELFATFLRSQWVWLLRRCSLICNGCWRWSNPLWSMSLKLFIWYVLMSSHFHKLTTELFNSIKTQQMNVDNASVDFRANCLCHSGSDYKGRFTKRHSVEQRIVGSRSATLLTRNPQSRSEVRDIVRDQLHFPRLKDNVHANECPMALRFSKPGNHDSQWAALTAGEREGRSQQRSLTDFGGGHRDVVPHVRLPVQRFGQRDLPVVHVDVELPLQVCVPINEIPAKTIYRQNCEPGLFGEPPLLHLLPSCLSPGSHLSTRRHL